jgi:hypothetical protein
MSPPCPRIGLIDILNDGAIEIPYDQYLCSPAQGFGLDLHEPLDKR